MNNMRLSAIPKGITVSWYITETGLLLLKLCVWLEMSHSYRNAIARWTLAGWKRVIRHDRAEHNAKKGKVPLGNSSWLTLLICCCYLTSKVGPSFHIVITLLWLFLLCHPPLFLLICFSTQCRLLCGTKFVHNVCISPFPPLLSPFVFQL